MLFGATGDLSGRLVVPALLRLFRQRRLPDQFRLIGIGRREMDGADLASHFQQWIGEEASGEAWDQFAACLEYLQGEVEPALFTVLRERLDALDADWRNEAVRVFYMATPPGLFEPIARGLGEVGLCAERARSRVVVEKPLGHDTASARRINASLAAQFEERQIFRIDHFLGKETVQNILALRFANPIFEPVWNRHYVDHVVITVAESIGVEHRGGYYEHAGALRDMVQNHLLQLLCLVAMEAPAAYAADDIRNRKLDVLRSIRPIPADAVSHFATRGQYGPGWIGGQPVRGYRDEPDVSPCSPVETYAALKLFVDNWRWQDVPFYLRTGKRMAAEVTEISIRFRDVPHRAYPMKLGVESQPVRLVIQIQPQPGIVLKFIAKEPGFELRLRPVDMRFCYAEAFDIPSPDAYETLLWDILRGDATLFMREEQVEQAWHLLEPILAAWESSPPSDFPNYAAGSWGPESAALLIAADGRRWLTPTISKTEICSPSVQR